MRWWRWTRTGVKWLALWAALTAVIWCATDLIGVFQGWKNAVGASGRIVFTWAGMAWFQARQARASRRDAELLRAARAEQHLEP
jgi:hypothetical protein